MRRVITTALAVVIAAGALAACDVNDMRLRIDSPRDGEIRFGPFVAVSGALPNYPGGGSIEVNGNPGTINPDGSWTATLQLDAAARVTPYEVQYHAADGNTYFQRRAVVRGPSTPRDTHTPDGVGMKFTNHGLAGLGPIIEDLAGGAFDIGGLLIDQNPVVEDENVFLWFDATANVYEAGIGGAGVAAESTPGGVVTTIDVSDLYVGLQLDITDNLLLNFSCRLEIQIPTTTITATFDLEPDPASPSNVKVLQVGQPSVQPQGLTYEFISGICDSDVFLIGDIVNWFAGPQVASLVTDGFQSALGSGGGSQGPIADAIETALAGISIAGPVGEAIGVNLDAPFSSITESGDGIAFAANANFFSSVGSGPNDCDPADVPGLAPILPGTYPNIGESFDVFGAFPNFGPTTPLGQPYGIGLAISASAFNQLLLAMTDCFLLHQVITEFTLPGLPALPLTAGLLSALVPAFAQLPPATPMAIRTYPTVAPFVSERPGPNGEPGELFIANLRLDFQEVRPDGTEKKHLQLAVDAPLGFDLAFDDDAGTLEPTITAPDESQVAVRVVKNPIGADEGGIQDVFPQVFPSFVDGLGDSFSAFPLPEFLGFQLDVVHVQRTTAYYVLYGNLDLIPQTRIDNVTLTDLSSPNAVLDGAFNVWEWRHRIRPKFTSDELRVDYKGVLGADACCLGFDAERAATAAYRLEFDVIPEHGDTWRLDVDHRILGAHTLIDEDPGGGYTQFTTPVSGRVRVGGGAWQHFNFTANPAGASVGNSGNVNVQFSGQNGIALQGSTAESVTVEISFSMYTRSTSVWYGGGDEAAIRFGANDTIANFFTAGGYPGLGNRDIVADGHFGGVTLTVNP